MTRERRQEFTELLRRATRWAGVAPDVAAVGVVGSWARGDERMDSDVDSVIVVDQVDPYLRDDGWVRGFAGFVGHRLSVGSDTTRPEFLAVM